MLNYEIIRFLSYSKIVKIYKLISRIQRNFPLEKNTQILHENKIFLHPDSFCATDCALYFLEKRFVGNIFIFRRAKWRFIR